MHCGKVPYSQYTQSSQSSWSGSETEVWIPGRGVLQDNRGRMLVLAIEWVAVRDPARKM